MFCVSLLVGLGLLHFGWLGPCWALLIRNFFFMGYALYGILAVPVTLEERGDIPTTGPFWASRDGFQTPEYFKTFGGVFVPITKESAICAFQDPVISLLGVRWYTLAYGEGIYCGAVGHTYKKHKTLYNILFVETSFDTNPV